VKVVPESVEWKMPLSAETQTSPAVLGFAAISNGEVELPSDPTTVNVAPLLVER